MKLGERVDCGLMIGGVALAMTLGLVAAGEDSSVFWRMIAMDVVSLAAGFAAWRVGWRRWLAAAPFVVLGWTALLVLSVSCPLVGGQSGWLVLGPFATDLWAYFPLVCGLGTAWLAARLKLKARWACLLLVATFTVTMLVRIVTNEVYLERIRIFLREDAVSTAEPSRAEYEHAWCMKAMESAKPFGRSELDISDMPCKRTSSLPAAVTARFGTWFFGALNLAFVLVLAGAADFARRRTTSPQRPFAAVAFAIIGFKSMDSLLCVTNLLPFFGWSLPFATVAGSVALVTSLAAGMLVSKR